MTPSLHETFEGRYGNVGEKADVIDETQLPNRKRLLFEVEKLLNQHGSDIEIEAVRKNHSHDQRIIIPNRDIYRLYKHLLCLLDTAPTIVYTGGSVHNMEEVKELVKDTDKSIEDLEPSL